ncbi:MAG: cytochrome P450 [Bacteroidota bacterium]
MKRPKHLWAPIAEENLRNPYPMYKRLRETEPVHRAQTGEWIITDFETTQSILRDKRFLSGNRLKWLQRSIRLMKTKDIDLSEISDAMVSFLLMMNPPEHTELRNVIIKAWNKTNINQFIESSVDKALNDLDGLKEFDLVKDYAQVIPVKTMCHVLGLKDNDHQYLKELGNEILKTLDLYISYKDLMRMNSGAKAFSTFFKNRIESLKRDKSSILYEIVKHCNENKIELSEKELISIAIFLFVAGVETSSSLIGTGLLNLCLYKDQLKILKESKETFENAINELLRYDASVQIVGRIASEDVEIKGKRITKGSYLTLCLGAANRDPNQFEKPDSLMLSRQKNKHLAFGYGIHYCLGDWLGQLQGEIAIQKFIEKFPDYSIPQQEVRWNKNLAVRSLASLKVHPS